MEKYTKIKIVGKGSFGYAVLVQDTRKKRPYVMKIIDITKMDKKQKAEALNEVTVFKELKFPYVISYRQSFIENGHLCIVMDYADGGDLYSKIAKQKEIGVLFPESLILNWFIKMALALRYVHDRKILHRDLKTQNIFLTSKGDVKIGDFGIARVLQHTYDCANTAIGTPYYLSPEICQEKPYNQKSDIWSLGCILYEMTTLNHAFDSNNMKGLVQKILKGSYPPIPPQYSPELRQVIASLLIKDPSKRPSMKKILELPFLKAKINELLTSTMNEYGHFSSNPIYKIVHDDSGSKDKRSSERHQRSVHDKEDRPIFEKQQTIMAERDKIEPILQSKKVLESKAGNISVISTRRETQGSERLSPSKSFSSMMQDRFKTSSRDKEQPKVRREKENASIRKDERRTKRVIDSDDEDPESNYGKLIHEMKRCLNEQGEDKDVFDSQLQSNFLKMNGQSLLIPGVSERDTVGSKIEALRYYLEKVIGEQFVHVYRRVSAGEDSDYQEVEMLLGAKSKFIPLVVQLIVCEDSYY